MGPTLRASCDSCNLAKVKCSKTRPCSRCKKHNLECIYGISLRAGKRAAPHHQHQWRQQEGITPRSEAVQSCFQNDWAWDVPPLSATHAPSENMSPFMFNYTMSCPIDEEILRKESFPIPYMKFGDSQPEHMPPISICSPALSSSARSWSTGSTSMTSPGAPSYAQSAPVVSPCNCFLATINTFSTMQQLADSAHISFDVALNQSKEAVALCASALKCRCTRESSVFLLIGSLIAKIISVYERPCGEWRPVEHNFPSQEATSGMYGRLRLGSYSVDESDEEKLKAEIVKMELKKAETLVAHLREIVLQSLQGPERTVCEALVGFLSERFRIAYEKGNESQTGRMV